MNFGLAKCPGVENFIIAIFLNTMNEINVKLCMMVPLIELCLFIPLPVIEATFQGHSSVSFNCKI